MGRFYGERSDRSLLAMSVAEQLKGLLRHEGQYKAEYSAQELAERWCLASGIPEPVAAVLADAPEWADAQFLFGIFECRTDLDARRGPSQTDLLALCALPGALGVLAIEGKVRETFGPLARDYAKEDGGSVGVRERFAMLCDRLGLAPALARELRYQLLHRTFAALLEAQRYRASEAIVLVHSFAPDIAAGHFADYANFVNALGLSRPEGSGITLPVMRQGIALRFAWVSDKSTSQR